MTTTTTLVPQQERLTDSYIQSRFNETITSFIDGREVLKNLCKISVLNYDNTAYNPETGKNDQELIRITLMPINIPASSGNGMTFTIFKGDQMFDIWKKRVEAYESIMAKADEDEDFDAFNEILVDPKVQGRMPFRAFSLSVDTAKYMALSTRSKTLKGGEKRAKGAETGQIYDSMTILCVEGFNSEVSQIISDITTRLSNREKYKIIGDAATASETIAPTVDNPTNVEGPTA